MSFRLFIYYCALCGGWAAFVGWGLGRIISLDNRIIEAGLKGMELGMLVALGLGLVDALWNVSLSRFGQVAVRVLLAVMVGSVGGLIGGTVGQAMYDLPKLPGFLLPVFLVMGWTITGFLIGASLGVFDLLTCLVQPANRRGALR